jgi:hypothetical protein
MSSNFFFPLHSMIVDEVSKQRTDYREAISSEQAGNIFKAGEQIRMKNRNFIILNLSDFLHLKSNVT